MKRKIKKMLSFCLCLLMAISYMYITPINANAAGNETGSVNDIKLTKTATDKGVDADGNQLFDIDLSVQGKKFEKGVPVDIVLVVDLSNSMTNNGSQSLAITKDAAKSFINTVLADGNENVRVALVAYGTNGYAYNFTDRKWVKYGSSISGNNYYTNNRITAENVIDSNSFQPKGISSDTGGTNTESGFLTAKSVTDTRNNAEATSIVVFMTDGVPTYRYDNNNNVQGKGSTTAKEDFNEAVDAAINLKNAGNSIYTVGLLTGYANDSNDMEIANKLLTSDASYHMVSNTEWVKCTQSHNRGQTHYYSGGTGTPDQWKCHNVNGEYGWYVTTTEIGYERYDEAYSSKYYPITEPTGAGDQIKEIYTAIAKSTLALVQDGVVADVIPADFKITDESKADLVAKGYTVTENEDGTTSVVFTGVAATDEKVALDTITVKYTGNGYGVAYTNDRATYSGQLYTGTGYETFTKDFSKPVAGLHPKTKEDKDEAKVNETINIDVTKNDNFSKLVVSGYEVSDYQIILTDKDGKPVSYTDENNQFTASVVDGKVVFVSSTDTTKEFYYVIQAKVTKIGDNFATNGQKTLQSVPTKVTVNVYDVQDKAFVIDFAKPVTYDANKVFSKSEQQGTTTLSNENGEYGKLSVADNKDVTYKLHSVMNGTDKFTFSEILPNISKNITKNVTMIPATSVYYDDSFATGKGDVVNGIQYSDNWEVEEKDSIGIQDSNIIGDGSNYGYDSSENIIGNSEGTVHKLTGTRTTTATGEVTFKGTGIDIYSYISKDTSKVAVVLYKQQENGTFKSLKLNNINTVYKDGELYQVPTISFKDLDYGTYKVKFSVGKNASFYMDGLRIYNPLGKENIPIEAQDAYEKDGEANAEIVYLRDILTGNSTNIASANGTVWIDTYTSADGTEVKAHEATVDSSNPTSEYINYGCKQADTYIPAGKSMTFVLKDTYSNVQIGLKANETGAKYQINEGQDTALNSSTDMYYKVTVNDDNTFTVKNTGNGIINITSLKVIK